MLAARDPVPMDLDGVFVPLITPFDADGAVAVDVLAGLAKQVLDDGAAGLVALGTTGEPGSLTEQERATVVDALVEVCRGRDVPLIVGASTEAAVRALPGEVSAAMALVPPFTRPGAAGVLAHLRAVAAASPVPLIVYHVPQRTGQELPPAALLAIAEIPGVVGVKYATGRIDADAAAFLTALPEHFTALCGDDALIAPMLALGARGAVAASAHLATADFARLVRDGAGDPALVAKVVAVAGAVFAEPNPTVLKAVLHAQGRIPTPSVRLPLLPAAEESRDAVLAVLSAI
jgi:4-hydroxy-tetrahydrodipicolinate synthase